jgi:ketosteroid isomerase-like protein
MSKQDIEKLETQLAQAMLQNDVAMLDRLLSDDLVFSGPDGVLVSKAEDLALHRTGDITFTTYKIDELLVQSYDPIEIAHVKVNLVGNFKGEDFAGDFRYLRIYLKQDEQWKIIGGQVTAIMD